MEFPLLLFTERRVSHRDMGDRLGCREVSMRYPDAAYIYSFNRAAYCDEGDNIQFLSLRERKSWSPNHKVDGGNITRSLKAFL